MNYIELINDIFQVCIIPLLGILTNYLVKFIQVKIQEIKYVSENDTSNKYLTMIEKTITSCVIATNQTYVETLKKEGKFDLEAQKKALDMTKEAVLKILSDEAKQYLFETTGDMETYLVQMIEAAVNQDKNK